jgi:WD40 repeat protein
MKHRLSERYVVIQCLGAGGFGSTYLAEDQQLPNHPQCVVKQLKPQLPIHIARRQFDTEAKMLYELGRQHDQIPQLYAHFEENQAFYLIQEFIEGTNLGQLIPGDRWTEGDVIAFLQDVLGILQFVHEQNVIHRDVKPANLIKRARDGKIVLIDFGAVKQISTQLVPATGNTTTVGFAIGTPGYMPNEQQGGKPRFSSDIYAVGIVAIQALTGLAVADLSEDLQTGELIWEKSAEVSPGLAAILNKMVRVHFRDRYLSAADVLHDLHVLQNPPTPNLPAQVVPKKLLRLRRRGVAIASSLCVGLGLGLVGYQYLRSEDRPSGVSQPTTKESPVLPLKDLTLANTLTVHTGAVFAIAISSDGQTFASGSGDQTIKLWKLDTGELLRIFPGQQTGQQPGHKDAVVAVAISPDSKTLVSASRDQTVKVWNLQTGALLHTFPHPEILKSIAISPDNQTVATGGEDHRIRIWNLKTGQLLDTFDEPLPGVGVEAVAITPDGRVLVSGSEDRTVKLWDLKTHKRLYTLVGHSSEVETIAISPNGQTIASGGRDGIFLWNRETGMLRLTFPQPSALTRSLVFSPDGRTLISGHEDNTIKLWNLDGELLNTLSGHADWILSVAISPDGKTLISGSRDKRIKIWRSPFPSHSMMEKRDSGTDNDSSATNRQ